MAKKLYHMYHACRITVKFNGFFVFAKLNFAKFRDNSSHIRMIFAFSRKFKNAFSFQPHRRAVFCFFMRQFSNFFTKILVGCERSGFQPERTSWHAVF
jgi:hypothetical protein